MALGVGLCSMIQHEAVRLAGDAFILPLPIAEDLITYKWRGGRSGHAKLANGLNMIRDHPRGRGYLVKFGTIIYSTILYSIVLLCIVSQSTVMSYPLVSSAIEPAPQFAHIRPAIRFFTYHQLSRHCQFPHNRGEPRTRSVSSRMVGRLASCVLTDIALTTVASHCISCYSVLTVPHLRFTPDKQYHGRQTVAS